MCIMFRVDPRIATTELYHLHDCEICTLYTDKCALNERIPQSCFFLGNNFVFAQQLLEPLVFAQQLPESTKNSTAFSKQ